MRAGPVYRSSPGEETMTTTTTTVDRVKELFAGFGAIDPERLADFFTDDAQIQPMMKDPYVGRADIVPCVGVLEFTGPRISAFRIYYDSALEGSTDVSGLNARTSR